MLKYFIPPAEGVKPRTFYKVEYTLKEKDPIAIGILGVGYLDNKKLPSINSTVLLTMKLHGVTFYSDYSKLYYIKILEELEHDIPCKYISDIQNIFELEQHNIQRNNYDSSIITSSK